MKTTLSIILVVLLFSCKEKQHIEEGKSQSNSTETVQQEEITPKNFTYEEIAKYSIATIMNQPPKIISVIKNDDLYLVSYVRKSDSQKFTYKIKFIGNQVMWGNYNGRWRDNQLDEKISFIEEGKKINIIQTFSDGSQSNQEFIK